MFQFSSELLKFTSGINKKRYVFFSMVNRMIYVEEVTSSISSIFIEFYSKYKEEVYQNNMECFMILHVIHA